MYYVQKTSSLSKLILVILGGVFFLGFLAIIIIVSVYYNAYEYPNDYAIVIDAGSSGTRTYVYTWKSGMSAYRGDNVTVSELLDCSRNLGIDKLTSKDNTILYFNDCLQNASKVIPHERKNRAYIILAATAGMRLLDITNTNQSNQILAYIRDHFSKSEFLFKSNDQVKIIDGKDEGLFAWISANYFANKFLQNTDLESTIGVLDLGGASTQISFLPSAQGENASTLTKYYKKLRIYGNDYQTYSNSFLCWGTNQFLLIYQTYLILKNNYSSQINTSCLNSNNSLNITTSTFSDSPCSNGKIFKFNQNVDLAKLKQNNFYVFNGISNPDECNNELTGLFPRSTCPYGDGKCTFNDVYLPKITSKNKFYAISSYYFQMANMEQLSGKSLKKNFTSYSSETKRICSLTYNQLKTINSQSKSPISDDYLNTTCFLNLYIIKLFSNYRINSFDNVEIVRRVNNYTVGWTLGHMIELINRENFLPSEEPPRKLNKEVFIPTVVISS
ncbi:unnamed protein product, partial [Brachionus calyciflorus]